MNRQSQITTAIDREQRLHQFRSFITDASGRAVASVSSEHEFFATTKIMHLGQTRISRIVSAPYVLSSGDAGAHANYCWSLCLQVRGSSRIDQRHNNHILMPGQWSLNHWNRPSRVVHCDVSEQLILTVPKQSLPTEIIALGEQQMGSQCAQQGAMRVLSRVLADALWDVHDASAPSRTALGHALIDMLHAALLETHTEARSHRSTELLHRRALAFLEDNLSDPNLSTEQVASALRCSKRYVQRVFQDGGSTLEKTIIEMRLQRGWRDLNNPALQHYPISTIAFALGFKDAAHFGKVFLKRFGVTPGVRRNSGKAGVENGCD
jgi:AraC-like DNA-binding protein